MDIQINIDRVHSIDSVSRNKISVSLDGVDKDDLMELINIQDAIKHFGEDALLDTIGKDKAKDFFDLTDNE